MIEEVIIHTKLPSDALLDGVKNINLDGEE